MSAPLRKIVERIRISGEFMGKDRVRLECGHEARTAAIYRARCHKCALEQSKPRAEAPAP